MKALTVYQPWASLIMIGAKPFEFRRWDYRQRIPSLCNQRIVIHASARPMKPAEVLDIVNRLKTGESALVAEKALPLLTRLLDAPKCQGVINLSAALGTAVLGAPVSVKALFKSPDSDRLDEHMFGWPLSDIRQFAEPVLMRGAQGFWNCDVAEAS